MKNNLKKFISLIGIGILSTLSCVNFSSKIQAAEVPAQPNENINNIKTDKLVFKESENGKALEFELNGIIDATRFSNEKNKKLKFEIKNGENQLLASIEVTINSI